jgi:nicotinate-nucleotide--dimethylbenzimidazole phosphoribosyltransferase
MNMMDADAAQWRHPDVAPLDRAHEAALCNRIDGKAKPPGSLGRIEALALQLGLIAQPAEPRADNAVLLVFAGDHGMTASGVSQYPSDVTMAMVKTFLAGRRSATASRLDRCQDRAWHR